MRIFFLVLVFVLSAAVLAACQPEAEEPAAQGPRLRITNTGPVPLEDLVVLFPDQRITFGDVPVGTTTEYREVPEGVYNYAAYEFTLNGETASQPVIDWVGETGRMEGDFTYVLSYDPERTNMLMIELVETQVE